MYRYFLAFLLCFGFLYSNEIDEIIELESGLAKDFVIYEYIKNHKPTSENAKKLYNQLSRKTNRLDILFNKYIKDEEFNFKINCQQLDKKEILKVDAKCAFLAISPQKIEKLSPKNQKILYNKLKTLYQKEISWINSMISDDTFKTLLKGDGYDFLKIFSGVSGEYRYRKLDKKLPIKFLSKLSNKREFESFVMRVAMDEKFKNLSISLLQIDPKKENLTYNSAFYLGILALKYSRSDTALDFFTKALNISKNIDLKDKARFWQYKTTNDKAYLKKLSKSTKFNLYSLYAKEELKTDDFKITSPKPTEEGLEYYSITDPYSWDYTKRHIKGMTKPKLAEFAKRFYTKETLPYYVYLMQRVNGFSKIYFITPYEKYIKNLSPKRKTLIYSIARQESRCIPVDVSKSYALGMMQFMPFLAKAVAKEEDFKNFRYFDMFNPKVALNFANIHLNYLQTYLFNPLFVAYAYNGGIGFTRRMLQNTNLFKGGKYEPYLSMELVPYGESREYGKKVVANYIIYSKIFGLDISLKYLLETANQPSLSYQFQ